MRDVNWELKLNPDIITLIYLIKLMTNHNAKEF